MEPEKIDCHRVKTYSVSNEALELDQSYCLPHAYIESLQGKSQSKFLLKKGSSLIRKSKIKVTLKLPLAVVRMERFSISGE